MIDYQTVLKIVALASVCGAGGAMIVASTRVYRVLASIFAGSLLLLGYLQSGLVGVFIISVGSVAVVPPIVILLFVIVRRQAWARVRKAFPSEPKQIPGQIPSYGDVLRLFWMV